MSLRLGFEVSRPDATSEFVLFAYSLRYSAPATISAALLVTKFLYALDS